MRRDSVLDVTVVSGPGPTGTGIGGAGASTEAAQPGIQTAGTGSAAAVELTVSWPEDTPLTGHSGRSLAAAMASQFPDCRFTINGHELQNLTAGIRPLIDGAVIVAWPIGGSEAAPSGVSSAGDCTAGCAAEGILTTRGNLSLAYGGEASNHPRDASGALLVVTAGPSSGATFPLHRGEYSLGRGHCRISVADPALSRHHGTLVVGTQMMTLTAARGSTGFQVQAKQPTASTPGKKSPSVKTKHQSIPQRRTILLMEGMVISCGSSVMELRFADPPGDTGDASSLPNISDRPTTATLLNPAALQPLVIPKSATSSGTRWTMILGGTLPLLIGVGLAIGTGSLMFLAFSAMGAVAVLTPLLGGARQRRAFHERVACATEEDFARQKRCFPDAAKLLLSSQATARLSQRTSQRSGEVEIALRLGTAARRARLVLTPDDPNFSPPVLFGLPVCAPLGQLPLSVHGPRAAALGLMNFALMQLDAAGVPVVLLGMADELPLSARFLPRTSLCCSIPAAVHVLGGLQKISPGPPSDVVVLGLNFPIHLLLAQSPGLRALEFWTVGGGLATSFSSTGTSPIQEGETQTAGRTSSADDGSCGSAPSFTVKLLSAGDRITALVDGQSFVPDGVPNVVFDRYARGRARQAASHDRGSGSSALAVRGSLAPNSLPSAESSVPSEVLRVWATSLGGPLRPFPLGQSSAGPTLLDLRRDGPHLLVGGTTGSGKSEFLRTLVGSLAVAHSPADVQFVFIDFKGGAGLGVLAKFPHTSSLITDLGGAGMDRTLASLRAELHRREAVLAGAEKSDASAYRLTRTSGRLTTGAWAESLAHLVVVIDEFRVLVDQYPDAMKELMRIAAVGRSLGMHLIMATQRPQGAINSDIRANVTSSICLRMQSSFESTDVIGTGAAAGISVATPGRAFISRAGGTPEEFQSATLRLAAADSGELPAVQDACLRLTSEAQHHEAGTSDATEHRDSDTEGVATLLQEAWQLLRASDVDPATSPTRASIQAAPAVVALELPVELNLREFDAAEADESAGAVESASAVECSDAGDKARLLVGMVDVPERQRLTPLRWHPVIHSHVACFGTAGETSHIIDLLGRQILAANAGSNCAPPTLLYLLDGDESLTHLANSPWVGSHLMPTQLRTVSHLVTRLIESASTSQANFVLCITDWSRWATALRSSPWHSAEDGLMELIRFSRANVAVAIGGGRELQTATFLPSVPNRIFLTCGSSAEATMLWPRLPRFTPLQGRAAIAGPINAAAACCGAEDMHVAQFATVGELQNARLQSEDGERPGSAAAGTLLVSALPAALSIAELRHSLPIFAEPTVAEPTVADATIAEKDAVVVSLVLGVGGDGSDTVRITLTPGTVLPVIGGPGSGKTTFAHAMATINGGSVLGTTVERNDSELTLPEKSILWLDDAAALSTEALNYAGRRLAEGAVIVASFDYPGPALARLPLEWGLRSAQQGIVLAPQRPGDGELFGVRLETVGGEPPGRAVLISRGRSSWFQSPLNTERMVNRAVA